MNQLVDPYLIRGELTIHPFGGMLVRLSASSKMRRVCLLVSLKIEKGPFFSQTAREILKLRYGVQVGAYSYGSCFRPGQFPPRVKIGRYVSIADGVSVLQRNHPMDRVSTHPFFFNSRLGYVKEDLLEFGTLLVGHDAWIGERATLTPSCRRIGIGAVVGASAVVTRDVPNFAVVAGNPARIIRFRFSQATQDRILETGWWLKPIDDLLPTLDTMVARVEEVEPIKTTIPK